MKRMMLVCVMILCIILSNNVALAVDWEQYVVPSDLDVRILLQCDGNVVSYWREDGSLRWFRNSIEVARLTGDDCPLYGSLTTRVALRPDGSLGVLLKRVPYGPYHTGDKDPILASYGIWTPESFTMIRQWLSADDGYSVIAVDGFLVAEASGQAWLYDLDCQELWSGTLGMEALSRPCNLCILSRDDWTVAVTDWNLGGSFACCRYIDGQLVWSRETMAYPKYFPLENGWTVIAEHRADGKNGSTYLSLIDPEGNLAAARYMSGDRLSVTCTSPMQTEDGTIVIYGRAIGNRRYIYQSWKLCLDENLNLLSLDVRNCRYHNDYSPEIWMDGDGSAWIRLHDLDRDGEESPDVFVPFDALPVVSDHSLRYGWGRPSDDELEDWGDK